MAQSILYFGVFYQEHDSSEDQRTVSSIQYYGHLGKKALGHYEKLVIQLRPIKGQYISEFEIKQEIQRDVNKEIDSLQWRFCLQKKICLLYFLRKSLKCFFLMTLPLNFHYFFFL